MELSDEITINASKAQVYEALNNPEILQQCMLGCETLIKHSETELRAKVVLKIAPVKARFSGEIELNKEGAPDSYSLHGKSNGSAVGHAKVGADVTPEDAGSQTILRYSAKVQIGGKIAQLGSRLIMGTAKNLR